MLKRMRWLAMGMGLGVWAQRRMKLWVKSYTPPEVAARAARRSTEAAGRRASELRNVFEEGRQAMRQREEELRREVDSHQYPPPVHYRPGAGR